jgi:hypothetical protein
VFSVINPTSFVYKYIDLSAYPKETLEWNFCRAEKAFYENISHTLHVPRVPDCYFAHIIDTETIKQSSLILEDLVNCEHNFTFTSGVPIPVFIEMTRSMAELHATFWGGDHFTE